MGFPLQQLRDIHEAPLPSDGLLETALWLLAALGLAGGLLWLALSLYRQRIWWRHYLRWRRLQRSDPPNALAINQFLKSLLLSYQPRQEIAALTGQAWLLYLDKLGQTRFSQFGRHWEAWLYGQRPLGAQEAAALLAQCHRLLLALRRQTPC